MSAAYTIRAQRFQTMCTHINIYFNLFEKPKSAEMTCAKNVTAIVPWVRRKRRKPVQKSSTRPDIITFRTLG